MSLFKFVFFFKFRPDHLPIILTGDFNSTPDSAVIKLLDRGHVRYVAYLKIYNIILMYTNQHECIFY